VSGDTLWFDGVADVARQCPVRTAVLVLGAARLPAVGTFHVTMTAQEAVTAARAFTEAGLASRLRWLAPGELTVLRESSGSPPNPALQATRDQRGQRRPGRWGPGGWMPSRQVVPCGHSVPKPRLSQRGIIRA